MSSVVDWIHEKREKEIEGENLHSSSSDGDGTCWDDEKTSRQWLWWIRAQQADAGILPFVVSAWMRLFSLQSVIYFDYLTTYVSINLLKIINISIVYSQLDTAQRERKNRCRMKQNDVHHSVLDRLHHKSEMYTSFHSPEHVKYA